MKSWYTLQHRWTLKPFAKSKKVLVPAYCILLLIWNSRLRKSIDTKVDWLLLKAGREFFHGGSSKEPREQFVIKPGGIMAMVCTAYNDDVPSCFQP